MTADAQVKVYRLPGSHYVTRAEMLLQLKGVQYERVNLSYLNFRRVLEPLSGQDEVPVLQVGDEVVTWRNIPDWLDAMYPDPRLLPQDPRASALARAIEDYADLQLGHMVRRLGFWRMRNDPEARAKFFGVKSMASRWTAMVALRWTLRSYGVTPFVVDQDEQTLAAVVDHLGGLLRENGNLVSKEISRADVAVVALLFPLTQVPRYRDLHGGSDLFRWVRALYPALRPTRKARQDQAPRQELPP